MKPRPSVRSVCLVSLICRLTPLSSLLHRSASLKPPKISSPSLVLRERRSRQSPFQTFLSHSWDIGRAVSYLTGLMVLGLCLGTFTRNLEDYWG